MYKHFLNFWHKRRERFYRRQKWHLVVDIALFVVLIILAAISIRLSVYHPEFINIISNPIFNNITSTQDKEVIKMSLQAHAVQEVVKLEEDLLWKINYHNESDFELKSLELNFIFESAAFVVDSLVLEQGEAEIKNNKLTLNNIAPGEQGTLMLNLNWRVLQSNPPRSLALVMEMRAESANNKFEKIIPLSLIKIISDLNVSANLFYHSLQGDQLGLGPIPPVVAIPTKYWLIVKADNEGNMLNNFIFSAQLAPEVELSEDYSLLAGKLSYDKSNRRLIWKIDSLDSNNGNYIANLALQLTPNSEQIGKNAMILTNINYYADDSWTGVELSRSLEDLDSSLPADRLNRNQGQVLPE